MVSMVKDRLFLVALATFVLIIIVLTAWDVGWRPDAMEVRYGACTQLCGPELLGWWSVRQEWAEGERWYCVCGDESERLIE